MKLLYYPDSTLKQVCEAVTNFDKELHQILDHMNQIMVQNSGRGLAANQVGITKRFFIMLDHKGRVHEFINPEILEVQDSILINEGCLSAPGVFVQIPRSKYVTVRAQDRNGEFFTVVCQDIEAVCAQHEMEHLDGKFFIDNANRQQKRAAYKQLRIKS